MGAVLTPAFAGLPAAVHLPNASTFCGRCEAVCPVGIPLVGLLRKWRQEAFEQALPRAGERLGLGLWRWINKHPLVYRLITASSAALLRSFSVPGKHGQRWLKRLPWFGGAWTRHRDLPSPAAQTFQASWRTSHEDRSS